MAEQPVKPKLKTDIPVKRYGAVVGSRSPYQPSFVVRAQEYNTLGLTEAEIGSMFGVSIMTLWRWRASHPEFAEAFKLGREAASQRIVSSMFHRAVGYTYPSEKIVVVDKKVQRVAIKEHVPPDVGAGQFLLTNWRPGEYRNRSQVEVGGPGDFDRMSDDELRRFIDAEGAQDVTPSVAPRQASEEPTGIAPVKPRKPDLFG